MKSILPLSFAVVIFAIASEKAMAVPAAPLSAGFAENHLTLAAWNRCWRDGWGGVRCGSAWR